MVKQSQLVSEWGAVGKDCSLSRSLQWNLRRIERHYEDRDARRQESPRSCRITSNVPLRLRRLRRDALIVAGAPVNASAHNDHSPELTKGNRIALNCRLNVEKRADGNKRDLAGMGANLVEKKRNCIRVPALGRIMRIGCLCEDI